MKTYIAFPTANGDVLMLMLDDNGQWFIRLQPTDDTLDSQDFGPLDNDDLTHLAAAWQLHNEEEKA